MLEIVFDDLIFKDKKGNVRPGMLKFNKQYYDFHGCPFGSVQKLIDTIGNRKLTAKENKRKKNNR